jgi:hypothetical protein
MASAKARIRRWRFGVLPLLLFGLAAGCNSSSNEKVDAGQRKYCAAPDAGAGKTSGDGPEVLPATEADGGATDITLDGEVAIDAPASHVDDGSVDGGDPGRTDLATDIGATDGNGGTAGSGGTASAGGTSGNGGTTGTGGVVRDASPDLRPDAVSDAKDAVPDDSFAAPDRGSNDVGGVVDMLGADSAPDVPADVPPPLLDASVDIAPRDSPAGNPDSLPAACGVNGCDWANPWPVGGGFSGLAMAANGTLWAAGQVTKQFNFGSDAAPVQNLYSGPLPNDAIMKSFDIVLIKLDPTTGWATAAFDFGDPGNNDQVSSGVTVVSGGNVGLIGNFTGEIDFTAAGSDTGVSGLDYLVTSLSGVAFYATFDGASTGSSVTPIKEHVVDTGNGNLVAIGSNPTQNAFVICGEADKVVPQSTNVKGLLTTTSSWVTGNGQDLVVAKINAADGTVVWGKQIGGTGDQLCQSATIDNNGDVIIVGKYNGTLDFGAPTSAFPVIDNTKAIIFAAKLNGGNGAAMVAQSWGTSGRSDVNAVSVDGSNNILLAGSISGAIDFGNGVSIPYLGLTDAYVAKFTTSLTPVWAKAYGDATHDQSANSIAADSSGNVLVGGTYSGSLGALGLSSASPDSADAFIAQLSGTDGSLACARSYGDAAGTQGLSPASVVSGTTGGLSGAVFMGGLFSSSMTLGSTTISTTGAGNQAPFVARLAP